MEIKIDKEKCIGCGTCVSMAEEVFEMTDDGKAQVKDLKPCEEKKVDCKAVAEACPVEAISIEE